MGTCYSHLSPDERIRIERLHCEQGLSVRETARLVGRDVFVQLFVEVLVM